MEFLLASAAAVACAAALRWSYRSLKAPFFLHLQAAGFSLACAAASGSIAWPPAEALADLGLAACGIFLLTASWQLRISFRLAGERHD